MIKSRFRFISILLVLIYNQYSVLAQQFQWQMPVTTPTTKGWHKIVLPPELVSRTAPGLGDLRLYNSQNKEIPYMLINQNYRDTNIIYTTIEREEFDITADPKAKTTRLHFHFKFQQHINRLVFEIDSPAYYFREARIKANTENTDKSNYKKDFALSRSFELNSKRPKEINIDEFLADDFTIEIYNNDNAPLHINKISLLQTAPLLIADLNTGESYNLKFGNQSLTQPRYDISYFVNPSTPMPMLYTAGLQVLNETAENVRNETTSPHFWQSKSFIWICISMVAIIIFFFSFKLLSEMKNK